MYKMINMKDYPGGLEKSIKYYHSKWGNENNFNFLNDAIKNSSNKINEGLPRFYLLLNNDEIAGCCGLIINDFISRHDLYPWIAGIFIEEKERGKSLGNFMMEYLEKEAHNLGFHKVYLTTFHDGYYEKYGWKRIEDGYEVTGEATKIYMKPV